MPILRYLTLLAAAALLCLGFAVDGALSAPDLKPFSLAAERTQDGGLKLSWSIAAGAYLYRDKISVVGEGDRALGIQLSAGTIKDDPSFGPTEIYHDQAVAIVPQSNLAGATRLQVGYQGCAERGVCFPPVTESIDLADLSIATVGADQVSDAAKSASAETWQPAAPPGADASWQPSVSGSWPALGLTFLGLGLLLALTPCILPMVPILAGMLSRSAGGLTAGRGFVLSSVYVLAMAGAYGSLGVAAAWSGQNLQLMLQAPAVLAAMAAVFAMLALASFGAFELRLPSAITGRLSGAAGAGSGPIVGAAVLGFTSALIVGPCVTPPLAAALIYVGQTGDVARGAFALFALGLGMGLPLLAVGTFGARILPRSGPWLLVANRAFGLVFLAIAILLVGRILPPQATMALWAALAVGTGVFIGAFDPVDLAGSAALRLRKTAGILAVAYGATLVVGAAAGVDDPLRPLAFAARHEKMAEGPPARTTVRSVAELDRALVSGPGESRPVLVEFSAEWCTSCRTIEREVLGDAAVWERLRSMRLIQADVTRTGPDSATLMRRFGVVGPPTLVFLDPRDGREMARSTGEISASDFRRTLDRVTARPFPQRSYPLDPP